jgi:small subunit ribosomal protein S8
MSLSDPIADMLTRIRNAHQAEKDRVEMPHSKLKAEVARILKKEGYVTDFSTEGHDSKRTLILFLKYGPNAEPAITGLSRASRPGLRSYAGSKNIPKVLGGMGLTILSTSSGVISGREARKKNVGGEVLCRVW